MYSARDLERPLFVVGLLDAAAEFLDEVVFAKRLDEASMLFFIVAAEYLEDVHNGANGDDAEK